APGGRVHKPADPVLQAVVVVPIVHQFPRVPHQRLVNPDLEKHSPHPKITDDARWQGEALQLVTDVLYRVFDLARRGRLHGYTAGPPHAQTAYQAIQPLGDTL